MPAVSIERIEAIPLRIPMDHWAPPPLFAGRPRTTIDTLLVRVTTNRDVVGWGEAYGGGWQATVAALDHWVSPLALGQDATDADLTSRIERTLHNLGRAGPIIHAISALDIALWDLRGKLEGVAVHALLGGRRRRRVEAYASLLSYGGSVEHVRRNVTRALERSYRQIKLHERTADTVAAAMAMAPSKPLWVEEPIWPPEDFSSLAALRRATGVPTAAGENATGALDFRKMTAAGAVDYVQPSAVKIGGLSALWRIASEAEADGVTCVPHAPYFGPGYLATLHVLAAKQRASALERFFCELALTPYGASVPVVDGGVEVPDAPGLGADPEAELIERFRT